LLEQSLKFSNPNEFNDPFDCHEGSIRIEHNKELIREVLYTSDLNQRINISRNKRRKLEKDIFKKELYLPIIRDKKNDYKLSCFSAKKDEVLMWSHYADMHRGICIGFNFPHKYEGKFILCPVKYIDKIVSHDGSADIIKNYPVFANYEVCTLAVRRRNSGNHKCS
jgi:hypothetical protein